MSEQVSNLIEEKVVSDNESSTRNKADQLECIQSTSNVDDGDEDKEDNSYSSDEEDETSLDRLFPIQPYFLKTTTNRNMTVFSRGDVLANHVRYLLEHCMDGFQALEEYLEECQTKECTHAISSFLMDEIFDLTEKNQDLYNKCVTHINELIGRI